MSSFQSRSPSATISPETVVHRLARGQDAARLSTKREPTAASPLKAPKALAGYEEQSGAVLRLESRGSVPT